MVLSVINEASPFLLGVWPQKSTVIRIQCTLNDSWLIFKLQDQQYAFHDCIKNPPQTYVLTKLNQC